MKTGVSLRNIWKHLTKFLYISPWLCFNLQPNRAEQSVIAHLNHKPQYLPCGWACSHVLKGAEGSSARVVQAFKPGFLGQVQIRYYGAGRKDGQDWLPCKVGSFLLRRGCFCCRCCLFSWVNINYNIWISGTSKTYWADKEPSTEARGDTRIAWVQ